MPPDHKTESAVSLKHAVPASRQGVSRALELVRDFADKAVPHRTDRVRLLLVAEELLLNVVAHGAAPSDSRLELEIHVRGVVLEIRLADSGTQFDPRRDVPAVPREEALADGFEGGAGWPMILEWCEIGAYERVDDRNRLLLLFNLAGGRGE
jgi:anti-sigma regulatory factor (Ser/Thr protein kinase)